jgi:phosphatidate phosphatase PAH1
MPAIGRDWSQAGVTGLYSQIKHNGYHFLYLTSRAIGQVSPWHRRARPGPGIGEPGLALA